MNIGDFVTFKFEDQSVDVSRGIGEVVEFDFNILTGEVAARVHWPRKRKDEWVSRGDLRVMP